MSELTPQQQQAVAIASAKRKRAESSSETSDESSVKTPWGTDPNAFERGLMREGIGVAQGVKHYIGIGNVSEEELAKQAKQLKQKSEGEGLLSTAGEIAGSPSTYAQGAGRLANAVIGGVSGAMQPVEGDEDYGTKKIRQTVMGSLSGLVGGEAANSIARMASPQFSKAVNTLVSEGVNVTPGMMANGVLKGAIRRGESSLASFPVLGSFIKHAEHQGLEDFNKAVYNRVLKPLEEKMPKNVVVGRDSLNYIRDKIGDAYDKVLPKVKFKVDPDFAANMKMINNEVVSKLTPDMQKYFSNLYDNIVGSRLKNGEINGTVFKHMQSELSDISRRYAKSLSPAEAHLGEAIQDLEGALRDNLRRMNPKYAKDLQKADTSYAAYLRARDASIRRLPGGEETTNIFSPGDLLRDIKSRSSRGSFAAGNGLMQDLAEAGHAVLPSTVRDSGSAERGFWGALLAGAGTGAGGTLASHAALPAAIATAPYTKPGMSAINVLARNQDPELRALLEQFTPAAAAAAGQDIGGKEGQ